MIDYNSSILFKRAGKTKTIKVLREMFKEDTGFYLLDSGNFLGRFFEENRKIGFGKKRLRYEIEVGEALDENISMYIDTYSYLENNLIFLPNLQELYEKFASKDLKEFGERDENDVVLDFLNFLEKESENRITISSYFGEGVPVWENSYNYETPLKQGLEYLYFEATFIKESKKEIKYKRYIPCAFIKVHGGCDIRAGYTKPKVFTVDEGFNVTNITINLLCVRNAYHKWISNDGVTFYGCNIAGRSSIKNLNDYPREDLIKEDEKNKIFCPICGGQLEVFII